MGEGILNVICIDYLSSHVTHTSLESFSPSPTPSFGIWYLQRLQSGDLPQQTTTAM